MASKPIAPLKKKLDTVFSRYIRARDKHICFTCDRVMEPKSSQCGHFVPRQYLLTRWDERNCNAQCYACNMLYNGQPSSYALRLISKHGKDIVEKLERNRHIPVKLDWRWYEERIDYYTKMMSNYQNW